MDVFSLVARLTLDSGEYDRQLGEASRDTESFGKKLGGGLATAAKVGIGALSGASAAVAALTKSVISGYAEYEQLVGGVETLFKDNAGVVQEYAANAYKTAGLSANEYMETVTSFSASLLQSLGGDTKQAADMANLAITDMSDNANKMGTDMSAIQDAYNGFAKQNYTMLDNLKLGYGGTKSEMERLIKDANKLRKEQGKNADLTIESYADVVEAIHTVQTEMGITGTTAKEASETISGSLSATKSAWKNLVVGIADENANFDELVSNFVDSAATLGENLIPRISQALQGIGQLVTQLAPVIIDAIPTFVSEVLPPLLQAAGSLVLSIGQAIVENVPKLIEAAISLMSQFGDYLLGIAGSDGSEFGQKVVDIVVRIGKFLVKAIPKLAEAALKIIAGLAMLLISAAAELVKAAAKLIAKFGEALKNKAKDLAGSAKEMVKQIVNGIANKARDIVNAGKTIITNIASGIANNVRLVTDKISGVITAIKSKITSVASNLLSSGREIIDKIATGIGNSFALVTNKFNDLKNKIKEKIENMGAWWSSFGYNIVRGIADGITKYANYVINAITRLVSSAWEKVKEFFGIASPSKLMKWAGKMLDEGFASGISDNADKVADAMDELNGITAKPISGVLSSAGSSGSGNAPNYGGIVMNIYGAEGQDVNELAEIVSRKLQTAVDRRRLTFA